MIYGVDSVKDTFKREIFKMKMTFALYFGNRGFFPEGLIAEARETLTRRVREQGFDVLLQPVDATRYGAVETAAEGRVYARFLKAHEGQYQGVILCLPNFGDENGASEALQNCGVPIYILACPDQLDKMDFAQRRDSFCGKLSMMDVFSQFRIPFTAWAPHTLDMESDVFAAQLQEFAAVCRVVRAMRHCRIGAVGARPTAFKTIRFDETALQNYGITTEVFDNSDLLLSMDRIRDSEVQTKAASLAGYTDFSGVPKDKLATLARLSLALDRLIAEHELDALGLRCWFDLEQTLHISPCVVLSELNDRKFPAACELDVGNAVAMLALRAAADAPATCLDWNNNYGDDPEKCILFHCGPVPQSLMSGPGKVIDHPMFAKTLGSGCAFGCNVGRLKPGDFTFASTVTVAGELRFYVGEGEFTRDQLPPEYFGCGGVARIAGLQRKINRLGYAGYRHHVSVAFGHWERAVREAFQRYLGYRESEL